MLPLLVFIDKDDVDKTKVPKTANTDIIGPGTNKAIIALEDGSHIVLEKGIAFRRHFAQFTPPRPLLSQFFSPQKNKLTECLITSQCF